MKFISFWTGAAALVVLSSAGSIAAASSHKAPAAGGAYYTAAQAAHGQKDYNANCASCHGVKLEGVKAPALAGAGMKGSQAIADIYFFMAQQMPAGLPGSLTPSTYASIMAYLLQKNGHPAGSVALTATNVKKIKAKI